MNNLEVLFDNIRLILESEDDEFFKKANNQLLANFEETLVGQDSKKILDDILIKGDEQGYTQEQYVNEIVATGELLNESCQELFKEYDGMILPASGGIAPKFTDSSEKLSDRYLLLENH